MAIDANLITGTLEAAGYRLTGPRRTLAELISREPGYFTAADLVAATGSADPAIGRATVFRVLELLSQLGLIERLDLPSGERAYLSCEPSHHHHVICSRCGRAADVADCGLAQVADEMGRRTGYRVAAHRLALFGLCPACQGQGGQP